MAFTPKIAAALLKNGKAKVNGLYAEKTGKKMCIRDSYGINAKAHNMSMLDRKQARCPNGLKLGTPATRAAILEKLVQMGFVQRKGKQLVPTKDGINLAVVLPESLTSPALDVYKRQTGLSGSWKWREKKNSRLSFTAVTLQKIRWIR